MAWSGPGKAAAVSSLLTTALSGLQAAQTQLQSSAHNVANAQTEGFRRQVARPQAQGAVAARAETLPEPGSDLAADLVEQKMASYAFQANLKVIRTADTLIGRLLDTQA